MKILTLEYIRSHSRICSKAEDNLLQLYGNSAEEMIAAYLNRGKTVDEMIASLKEEYGSIPFSIMEAALMLVDISYNNRSPLSPTNYSYVPYSFDMKIKPYMNL